MKMKLQLIPIRRKKMEDNHTSGCGYIQHLLKKYIHSFESGH